MINLPARFNSTNVKSSLVSNKWNFITPTLVYDLTASIRAKIFNFNNFVLELDVDQFLADPTILPCNCDKFPFVEKDDGHILTGGMRIIKNNNLRMIIRRGRPKISGR